MNKLIDSAKKIGGSAFLFLLPLLAKADPAQPAPAGVNGSGLSVPSTGINSVQSVLDFMCTIFGWMFYFLVALAVIFVVIAAYRYLSAGGNPENVKKANSTIMYAAIAIAVALLARAIPYIVADFLGANTGALISC